jgi:hypothetical protein
MPHELANSDAVQLAIAVTERFAPDIDSLEDLLSVFLSEAAAGVRVAGGYSLSPLIIREVLGKRLGHVDSAYSITKAAPGYSRG